MNKLIEEFTDTNKETIIKCESEIKNLLSTIINYNSDTKIEVIIVEKDTRIYFNFKKETKQTLTGFNYPNKNLYITLYLGYEEIMLLYNNSDFLLKECIMKISTHEILHILLGHFSNKYLKYDQKLLNLAGDMEINTIIRISKPFIVPESFGFPTNLKTDQYYKLLLYYYGIEKINSEFIVKDEHFIDYNDIEKFNKDNLNFDINDKKYYYQKSVAMGIYGIKNENKEKIPNKVTNLDGVIRQILRTENCYIISKINKVPNWSKFNNRKSSNNFLIPGNTQETNGTIKKFDNSSLVFIDTSSSTDKIISSLNRCAIELRKKCNCVLIEYNTEIKNIINPSEKIELFRSYGGTSIRKTLDQYLTMKNHIQFDRVYVITDGEDTGLEYIDKNYKSCIWIVNNENKIILKKF